MSMKKKEPLEPEKVEYPRLLQNTPTGEDWYEGQSQQKLAETISGHILKNDAHTDKRQVIPRIIGIEGEWGSGKSNVVKLLVNKLGEKYIFYVYDAWGNQVDLQKRTILEQLTNQLVTSGDLKGDSNIVVNGATVPCDWHEKLKYLVARKKESDVKSYPKYNPFIFGSILAASGFPVCALIADRYLAGYLGWYILLTLFPLLILFVSFIWSCRKEKKLDWNLLFAIYNKELDSHVTYETISEEEPSVRDFRSWMQSVSDGLGDKKLVMVFDNMDRLPADKVKSLWAIIHTFFAESGFDNVWVIVPYDKNHLSTAFGENKEDAIKLAQHFIEKTFPVVYRVAPAILTDQKKILDKLLLEAFGEADASFDTINRIYRISKPNSTVREMKLFTNDLVAMKQQWGDDISYLAMALFSLHHDEIVKNPEKNILQGNLLGKYSKLVEGSDELVNELASLMYGIDLAVSRQILIKKMVRDAMVDGKDTDLNAFVDKFSDYATLVIEMVQDIDDVQLDQAIMRLDDLQMAESDLRKLWKGVFVRYIKLQIENIEFPNTYKVLLKHVNENEQQKLVERYLKGVTLLTDVRGELYGKSLMAADVYLKENYPNLTLKFVEKAMEPVDFLGYLAVAKNDYKRYNVITGQSDLDTSAVKLADTDRSDLSSLIYLKGDSQYDFTKLKMHLETSLAKADLDTTTFERHNKAYLAIATEYPIDVKYNINAIANIFNSYRALTSETLWINEGYLHSQAILIANKRTTPKMSTDQIEKVAKVLPNYISWSKLIKNDFTAPTQVSQELAQYAVRNNLASEMSVVEILQQFENYKSRLQVTSKELLNQLAVSADVLRGYLNDHSITTIFTTATIFKELLEEDNEICKMIHVQVLKELQGIPSEQLQNNLNQYNSHYWHIVLATYCDSKYLPTLPDNVASFVKSWWLNQAKNFVVASSNDYMLKLLQYIQPDKLSHEAHEVRNQYCNQSSAINPQFFKNVAPYLLREGVLKGRYPDVAIYIVLPTISNDTLLPLWYSKSDLLKLILDEAGEAKDIVVNKLRELKKVNNSSEYEELCAKLDISGK